MTRPHLADRDLVWSPLNRPPAILDHESGRLDWSGLPLKVCIYGSGYGRDEAPLDDPSWQVWALNLVAPLDRDGKVRADVWFDIHQKCAQTEDDLRWIAKCPVPIFVPDDLLGHGPTTVRFPIEAAQAMFGSYFACTFAYQIALALMVGATDIGLFGCELLWGPKRERTVEMANVSWWLGYAEAKGVRWHLPAESRMGRHEFLYGLEYQAEIDYVKDYVKMTEEFDRSEAAGTGEAL